MRRHHLLLLSALLAAACSRSRDESGRERAFAAAEGTREAAPAFDPAHPETALALGPEEVARRLGSFEWTSAVDWTVSRGGDAPARVHVAERHRVRQSAAGEFEVEDDLDPGLGEGSETGRHLVFVGGMTYARDKYAPFGAFRERSADHGRDARRYRDESFGALADLARLCGPALAIEPAGDATVLGRPARRYRLALAKDAPPPPAPEPRTFGAGGPDADTKARLAFLDGRVPLAIDGELVADAETGVPLRARLRGTFGTKADPSARAQVDLVTQVRALGSSVGAVAAPKALPDARKPPGVSDALEAAGLKQRGEREMGRAEPREEGGE
jgi:hypothetical protein